MRQILIAIVLLTTPAGAARAGPGDAFQIPRAKAAETQKLKTARPQTNFCAQFGPGFARIEGSDTCVRIGGSIGIGVGGSIGTGR